MSAIGGALTKSVDDATGVVQLFSDAVDTTGDLEGRAAEHPWVYKLTINSIAGRPADAGDIVEQAEAVLQHAIAASQNGVAVGTFEASGDALGALSKFNAALAEWNAYAAGEGLPQSNDDLKGHELQTATSMLQQRLQRLQNEKLHLIQEATGLVSQLESVGRTLDVEATTVAELKIRLPQLRSALEERRLALREFLGKDVYGIVQALAKGKVPPLARTDDTMLGHAVRKAADSGYVIRVEVPRED